MRARWPVVVAVILGVLGMSFAAVPAVAAPAASPAASVPPAAAPVTLGNGFITDLVGALGTSETEELNSRLEKLSKTQNIQLFVVFVDTFSNPDNSQQWTNQVAVDNGLGQTQYLLAIATQSRQYYLSADKAGPVPLSRVDQISQSLVNDLHADDWAGAVRTAADGFSGSVLPTSAGSC